MFDPWVGKISWRMAWQATPLFLPGKSCEQRSLVAIVSGVSRVRYDSTQASRRITCLSFSFHIFAELAAEINQVSYLFIQQIFFIICTSHLNNIVMVIPPKLFLGVKLMIQMKILTLCNPVDCILPGSSIHRIFQARILEWVAIAFSEYLGRKLKTQQDDNKCI